MASVAFSFSVPPIVERVELSLNRRTALLSRLFEVSDGPHDVRVAHVPRRVIVLVHGEDAGVPLVQVVKSLEVCGILRDDGVAVCGSEAKVTWSSAPSNPTASSVGRTTRCPACRSRSARRSEFEQSSRYRLRATGNLSPLEHQPLDLRLGLQQLPVALDIGQGLADSLDWEMIIGRRRRLVELVRLHRPDELPGRHVSPFDVELLSPGM